MQYSAAVAWKPQPLLPDCESLPYLWQYDIICRYMDYVCIVIAYVKDDQLVQASRVEHFIAAEGTGHPPPLVLNSEPERPQRVLEMSIIVWGQQLWCRPSTMWLTTE